MITRQICKFGDWEDHTKLKLFSNIEYGWKSSLEIIFPMNAISVDGEYANFHFKLQ
jgi:hypothetical protein